MRVLTIAISTLSAFAVQELAYTRSISPNISPPSSEGVAPVNRGDAAPVATSTPIAVPEVSLELGTVGGAQMNGGQPLGVSKATAQPTPIRATKRPNQPIIRPVDVKKLPIDAIINQSLAFQTSQTPATDQPRQAQTVESASSTNRMPGTLPDIQGHWAEDIIRTLASRNIVRGFTDGHFHPDAPITPIQFAAMARRSLPQAALSLQEVQRQHPGLINTRADAAAFLYQSMVDAGQTPAIAIASPTPETQRAAIAQAVATVQTAPSAPTSEPSESTDGAISILPALQAKALHIKQKLVATVIPTTDASTTTRPAVPAKAPTVAQFDPSIPPPSVPAIALAAQEQDYVLGAGDDIRLEVFDVPEYSKEYRVLVNGALNVPLLGSVSVDGLTLKQAGNLLSAKYAPYLTRPRVTVTLIAPRPLNVGVAGEVNRPGSYSISVAEGGKFPTLTKVVQMAGGITQTADLHQVEVRRPQRSGREQVIRLDLWQLLQVGDLRQDLTLRDGDSIFIPATTVNLAEAPQLAAANFAGDASQPLNIAVVGEVQRPGPHILAKTETNGGMPTVTKAIQQAGGITQSADIRQVQIRRMARSGTAQTINVNLLALLQEGDLQQDLILQQGDTVVIPTATSTTAAEATQLASASFSPDSIKVNVVGEVERPGAIEVKPNTPLNQALLSAGGFNNRAHKRSVQLIRLNPNGTVTQQKIAVDLTASINETVNPMLRNNDIIVIGRSGSAKLSDTLNNVLGPLGRILPFVLLF
ncbi:MAG: SLBB domain-containing protein [Scytolyngbya sp. HA4215-MV1]|jgi:polysaccharide export outer membrane protein|nr:SLBB domain-containing protein [Scytolyngbya sp. HA4215-MV1]